MRWKKLLGGLALVLATSSGCKQQCFMTEYDLERYRSAALGTPSDLDTNPAHSSILPSLDGKITADPATVFNPEREVRYLTLAESFALAMERGTVGQGLNGLVDDSLAASIGDLSQPLDRQSIRVLALEPALVGTNIDAALSKFDARWVTSMNWQNTDRPVGTALDAFQASGRALNAIETTDASFRSTLLKPLPTGGVAGITFNTDYQFTNLPARVNPSYRPALQFQFEQPLLRGYGVELNQIAATHPGAVALQNLGVQVQPRPENQFVAGGILIARIRYDQSRAVLEAQLNQMMLNVETAYWNLYAAYGELYAREIAMRQNLNVWRTTKVQVEAGKEKKTAADLFQAEGQFQSSRSDWLRALGQVLERERNLRGLIGLPVNDGTRLVPADAPTLAPVQPDWQGAVTEALTLRPELVIARDNLKAQQLSLIEIRNRLLPDLRFAASYDSNSIGSRLDGADADNAFRNLATNRHNNWTLGLRLDVPIGFRDAHAGLRQARLRLAQQYWSLRTMEDKAQRFLALQYRNVAEFQQQIVILRSAVEAYNNQLNVRLELVRSGKDLATDVTLEAIRFGSTALQQYFTFVAQYNSSLAAMEYAKGTLLKRNNIVICEGALPGCAQVRAVEHEHERSKALVLRERALGPGAKPGCADGCVAPLPGPDKLAMPELLKSQPPLPREVYEPIPGPKAMPAGPTTPLSTEDRRVETSKPAATPPALTLPSITPTPPAAPVKLPATPTVPTAAPTPARTPPAGGAAVTTGTITYSDEPPRNDKVTR